MSHLKAEDIYKENKEQDKDQHEFCSCSAEDIRAAELKEQKEQAEAKLTVSAVPLQETSHLFPCSCKVSSTNCQTASCQVASHITNEMLLYKAHQEHQERVAGALGQQTAADSEGKAPLKQKISMEKTVPLAKWHKNVEVNSYDEKEEFKEGLEKMNRLLTQFTVNTEENTKKINSLLEQKQSVKDSLYGEEQEQVSCHEEEYEQEYSSSESDSD